MFTSENQYEAALLSVLHRRGFKFDQLTYVTCIYTVFAMFWLMAAYNGNNNNITSCIRDQFVISVNTGYRSQVVKFKPPYGVVQIIKLLHIDFQI